MLTCFEHPFSPILPFPLSLHADFNRLPALWCPYACAKLPVKMCARLQATAESVCLGFDIKPCLAGGIETVQALCSAVRGGAPGDARPHPARESQMRLSSKLFPPPAPPPAKARPPRGSAGDRGRGDTELRLRNDGVGTFEQRKFALIASATAALSPFLLCSQI